MKKIQLNGGQSDLCALVDDEDYAILMTFKWYWSKGYAITSVFYGVLADGKRLQATFYMHRILMGCLGGEGIEVDHINHDRLDNRRSNLRRATGRENRQNLAKRVGTSSQYKGVSWNRRGQKWEAYVGTARSRVSLGRFNSETAAAAAYNTKAAELYGQYAHLNKIAP